MGLFEPAVAHGLAPSAAAASSDALVPKPLAASSGTASACSYESTHACEVRLNNNRSGVQRSSRLNELRCQGEGSSGGKVGTEQVVSKASCTAQESSLS